MTGATAAGAVDTLPPPPPAAPRRRSLEGLFVAALVLFGFRAGARPMRDNSTLGHLRTGLDMAHGHGIPRFDPYSFTAHGHRWVVQSWLPEWSYGLAWRLGGSHAVVLEQAVLTALLAWLVAYLARAGSALRTAAAATVAIWAGSAYWSPRPLLFGLLFFGLTVLIVEQRKPAWWLVPVVWLWVNSHGSFPLGGLWLGAVILGEAIDRRGIPRRELRYLGAFVAGLAASTVNPLGPRLLLFPLTVGDKKAVFDHIVEWRSPDFQSGTGLFTLLGLTAALVILVRYRTRWRYLLPVALFLAAGLYAVRNLSAAAIVLAPALGTALRSPAPSVPAASAAQARRRPVDRMFAGIIALGFVIFGLGAISTPGLQLAAYPVEASNWIEANGLATPDHRMVEADFVGNYLIWRNGTNARVFIDDRYDMYPPAVSRDSIGLLSADRGSLDVLDCRRIDVVLWDRRASLVELLLGSGQWRDAFHTTRWGVYVRTRPPAAGAGGVPVRRDGTPCPSGA